MSDAFMAFATGFLDRTSEIIDKAREKEEEYRDKLTQEADKAKPKIGRIREIVGQARGLAAQAKQLGATPDMIEAAVASGPNGLVTLTTDLTKIKRNMGSRWDPEVVKNYAEMPEGFKGSGRPIDEIINETYGFKVSGVGSTAAPERNWLQRLGGKGYKAAIRAELDKDVYHDGYTITDLAELANQEEYKSLMPGTFMTIASPKFFDPDDVKTERSAFDDIRTDAVLQAKNSDAYVALENDITTAKGRKDISPQEKPEHIAYIKSLEARQAALLRDSYKPMLEAYIRGRVKDYTGGGYLESMGDIIDLYLGEGVTAALIGEPEKDETKEATGTDAKEQTDTEIKTEELDPTITTLIQDAGGEAETTEDGNLRIKHPAIATITGGVVDEVEAVYQDGKIVSYKVMVDGKVAYLDAPEDVQMVTKTIRSIRAEEGSGRSITQAGVDLTTLSSEDLQKLYEADLLSTDDLKAIRNTAGGDKKLRAAGLPESPLGSLFSDVPKEDTVRRIENNLTVKYNVDPEAWYVIYVPQYMGERKIKGSDLATIPDSKLTSKRDEIVVRELEPGEKPPRKTASLNKVQRMLRYDASKPQKEADEIVTKEEDVTPTQSFFDKHSEEVLKALEEIGYTKADTEMDIAAELQDWYEENKNKPGIIPLPEDEDLTELVKTIKSMLKEE